MNDEEYEKQKARLVALADKWVKKVGLGWWRVTNSYDRDGSAFSDSVVKEPGFSSQSVARCYPEWRYLLATIIWNMPEVENLDDEELEYTFVHELMHIFLHEMRSEDENAREHEERVATMLAKGFIWATSPE